MEVNSFNPSVWEAETGGSLLQSSRPAWSIQWVQGQPGLLQKETLSCKSKTKKQKPTKQKKKKEKGKKGGYIDWSLFNSKQSLQLVYFLLFFFE